MILAHQIALDLTDEQVHYCRRAAGTARFTYDWGLAEWQRQYRAGQKPTALGLKKQWNALKHAHFSWVAATHKDANQHPFTQLATAFQQFFRHEAKYPRFKKKGQHDRFYVSNDKCTVAGKRLRLPVLGWVRMREALRFTGTILSVTVSRTAHRWYASIAVRVEDPPRTCENQAVVGVDLGITRLATLSNGTVVDGPQPLRKLGKASRRLHRRRACTVKGSKNRQKAQDRLARALSARGFGTFRRLLTSKAAHAGARLIVADRWFSSSKRCRRCGVLYETLPLQDRTFCCQACGVVIDRDLNAAVNLSQLPWASGEGTPVDTAALATVSDRRETAVGEAETTESALLRTF